MSTRHKQRSLLGFAAGTQQERRASSRSHHSHCHRDGLVAQQRKMFTTNVSTNASIPSLSVVAMMALRGTDQALFWRWRCEPSHGGSRRTIVCGLVTDISTRDRVFERRRAGQARKSARDHPTQLADIDRRRRISHVARLKKAPLVWEASGPFQVPINTDKVVAYIFSSIGELRNPKLPSSPSHQPPPPPPPAEPSPPPQSTPPHRSPGP